MKSIHYIILLAIAALCAFTGCATTAPLKARFISDGKALILLAEKAAVQSALDSLK